LTQLGSGVCIAAAEANVQIKGWTRRLSHSASSCVAATFLPRGHNDRKRIANLRATQALSEGVPALAGLTGAKVGAPMRIEVMTLTAHVTSQGGAQASFSVSCTRYFRPKGALIDWLTPPEAADDRIHSRIADRIRALGSKIRRSHRRARILGSIDRDRFRLLGILAREAHQPAKIAPAILLTHGPRSTRFSKPEDAEAFAKRFDGKRLPTGSTRSP
jgi:hypothetical protein